MSRITESLYRVSGAELTEARNPENDEVNAVLRKWANSDRNRISKRDQKVLDDAGITLKTDKYDAPHKYAVHKNNEGDIIDLKRMDKYRIKKSHPDHDLANDLATTGRHWSNRDRYNKNKDPNFPWRNDAYREETPEESKALRPYSDEYKSLKRQVKSSERYPSWHDEAEQDLDNFRAKMAAKKDESLYEASNNENIEQKISKLQKELKNEKDEKRKSFLQATINIYKKKLSNKSLNESAYDMHDGGLRDEFYSLIEGMDPEEVISWLLSYMNDYDLDELIRDARREVK